MRPEHLFVGTRADNMRDAGRKGRHGMQVHPERSSLWRLEIHYNPRGEANHSAKLTTAQVLSIRAAAEAGERHSVIARRFAVAQSTIAGIVKRKAWTHV